MIQAANDLAEVKDYLDWEHAVEPDGSRSWCLRQGDVVDRLTVKADGSSVAERIPENGKTYRHLKFCKPAITDNEIRAFFKSRG